MALLFIDGFDHYVSAEIARKWSTNNNCSISSSGRRVGSKALSGSGSNYVEKTLPSAINTIVVGFAYNCTNFETAEILSFTVGGSAQVTLTINSNGSISVYRGLSSDTLLGTSASGIVTASSWPYIEFKVFINDSTGTYEVKINESTVLSGTGADTKQQASSGADTIKLMPGSTSFSGIVDDLYIDDANFKGDCRIDTLMPSGAGATTQWTPSAGSNFQNVDDPGDMDDDTTYNSEATAGEIDVFVVPDIEATGGTIHTVAVNAAVYKDDSGARTLKGVIREGSTNYSTSVTHDVQGTYKVGQFLHDTQPDGGGAWDEGNLNAAEFGVEMDA